MSFFLENASDDFRETETIGGFNRGTTENDFNSMYENTFEDFAGKGINLMTDITQLLKNSVVMESYKERMLETLNEDCANYAAKADCHNSMSMLYEQVSALWDNCVSDLYSEQTTVGQLLPIKAIDLPVLVKQQIKLATKDIMQTEVTKSPVIKKHIEQMYVTDTKNKKSWKYPQCFFNDEYKEIYSAGKGIQIPSGTAVELPLMGWDLITNLCGSLGAQAGRDSFTMDLQIIGYEMDTADSTAQAPKTVTVKFARPMRINLSDGQWLGGDIKKGDGMDDAHKAAFDDLLVGNADTSNGLISLSSCAQKVKKVYFGGYLSNELNERYTSIDYKREELEWKIEDGHRMNIPYSLEQLEDSKALLQIDLYKKTYDNLADIMANLEDSKNLTYLDDEYAKYKGVELDPLGFNSFIREQTFNAKNEVALGVVPAEYIEKMLKWTLDRFLIDIADSAKMEEMTFVMYGNPRYVALLGPSIKWIVNSGDMVGGIKSNYSYGILTSGDFKVQVVSTNKLMVGKELSRGLRIIPYPLNSEQMTFKHYKYTTHILTTANSGYRAADRPGGSMTNLMATSRYTNVSVQGIQGHLSLLNDDFIMKK